MSSLTFLGRRWRWEASARRAGQYSGYGQAPRAQHPAARGVSLSPREREFISRDRKMASAALPGGSERRPGA